MVEQMPGYLDSYAICARPMSLGGVENMMGYQSREKDV